jgi:hypothetical protein
MLGNLVAPLLPAFVFLALGLVLTACFCWAERRIGGHVGAHRKPSRRAVPGPRHNSAQAG